MAWRAQWRAVKKRDDDEDESDGEGDGEDARKTRAATMRALLGVEGWSVDGDRAREWSDYGWIEVSWMLAQV